MRKCLRCETPMVEDMAVMVTNKPIGFIKKLAEKDS